MKVFQRSVLLATIFVTSFQVVLAQTPSQTDPQPKSTPSASLQIDAQEIDQNDVVRVTTSLVRVPVSVRDRDGRYIIDLKQEDFRIHENGAEQRIAYFGSVEEPVSVVLLIDVSCSIAKPEDTKAAALTFIDQLRPGDSLLPIAFGTNIYALLTKSTRDHALLQERILSLPDGKQTPCDNGTRLGDAIDFVIHRILKYGTGRRAVILLTDGRDSMLSRPGWLVRTLRDASQLGVPFYSIRLTKKLRAGDFEPPFTGFPNDPLAEQAKWVFFSRDVIGYIDDLASLSGGRSYPAATGDDLKKYFAQIGEELRHQYMLAYYPQTSKKVEERRKIKVRVNRQKVSVRARDSYIYIPTGK
jgi:VWFA-related protein